MKRITVLVIMFLLFGQIVVEGKDDFQVQLDFDEINSSLSDISHTKINYETILEYIKTADFKGVLSYFGTYLTSGINNMLVYHKKIMFTLLALCMVSVLINMFSDGEDYNINDKLLIFFTSGLLINLYIYLYNLAYETVNHILSFMHSTLPVYFGITAVLSEKLPLSVYSVFVVFVTIFQWLAVNIIFPLLSALFLCTILSGIYSDIDLKSMRKFITGIIRTILGLYTTFFILGLKITQTVTYSTQKLVLTGIQYTVSKGVPVIGGFLSETAETLFSSIMLLHNSVGVSSILVIIFLLFLPFITVFFVSVIIKFMCALISPFSGGKILEIISSVGDCISELSVVLLCAAVTFVIAISTEFITVR